MNQSLTHKVQEQIKLWSVHVPIERSERIMRFRFWQDQWRSLAGDMLVQYVLRKKYSLPSEKIVLTKNHYNKPMLLRNYIQFNVSHAGNWVVAAFHSSPIGIDIEGIGKADMQLAEAMFASSEVDALRCLSGRKQDELFYAVWTGKESYIKAVGKGLSIPLHSFSVAGATDRAGLSGVELVAADLADEEQSTYRFMHSIVRDNSGTRSTNWYLRHYELDPDYMLALCSSSTQWPQNIVVVDAEELDSQTN